MSIGKHNGFMHLLDAVLVHKSLCSFMKRTLVVKVWFISMLCFVFYISYVFDCFSNAGLHKSCCGLNIVSTLSFLPRKLSCIISMAQGKDDAMLIISCIFVHFIGQCRSAWKTVIKVMLSLQDGVA